MCGVVGFYAYRSGAAPADRQDIRAIRDAMALRGPDDEGEWYSAGARAALAHRRLSIIDLSRNAVQPMASADGRLVISFNGEIYNYRELRAELERHGEAFRTNSDTEVLLHLYRRHGTAMLPMLRGMFAFALWDEHDRAMLLARDPLGIKPLYYADDGGTLRAASQVKALLQSRVDARPDAAGHAGYWVWGSVPEPFTLYRGIRALPAGHHMWVREGRCESPQPHCTVADVLTQAASSPARGSREEAIEAIRASVRSSVAAHLVADVPVSVFLSSGLDSGMICSQVAAANVEPHTVTLGFWEFAGSGQDEVPLAEEIARTLGARHRSAFIARRHFEVERERMLRAMDQPSIDGANSWLVSREAAARGVKVALSGVGGDEIFASYPSFTQVPRLSRAMRPFASVPALGRGLRRLSAPWFAGWHPKAAGLAEFGGTLAGAYLLRRALHMPWELESALGPSMAREGWEALATLPALKASTRFPATAGGRRLAVSALEMGWYMRNQLLRDADWAGMGHSLEIRTPFADIQLVRETAPWFAAHPDITKMEVAEAVAPGLHDSWLKRPKTGFSVPVREWLASGKGRDSSNMREWARAVLGEFRPLEPQREAPAQRPEGSMRVLLLTTDSYGGHGGIAFYNRCLSEALAEMPEVAEVVVVPRVMRFAAGPVPPKIRFIAAARGSKTRYLLSLLPLLGERFDMVVCGHINLLPAAVPFAALKRLPLVLQVHGIEAWKHASRVQGALLPRADTIWSVSRVTAERMDDWAGLGPDAYRVVPNTFHAEQFGTAPRDPALVRRYGLEGRKVIMTLCRLAGFERYKGIDEILECMPRLIAKDPSVTYMVVGDGDDQARLEAKARSLGVAANVIFAGFVEEGRKADFLRLADVFALPGRGEGFGIVFLEALACGVPVVGSQLDGSREALLDGELGELANPDSIDSVVACIERALAKPHGVPPGLAAFGWPAFRKNVAEEARRAAASRARIAPGGARSRAAPGSLP